MRIHLAVLIALVPLLGKAAIYRSVDSNGNVVFSDQPTPGAKKIIEQLAPVYVPPPSQIETTAPPPATITTSYYTAINIRKPASGATLRDADGTANIELDVVPPLKSKEGHVLVVAVDGNNLASHDNAMQLTISNLAAGVHTLKAQILDATGQVQFSSGSITFFMQRSAAAPNTKAPASPSRH